MHILRKYKVAIIILLLSFIGGIFRFYNLDWGSPFYFHPDERNIASSVAQLNFLTQMNPHFFAYGSLPIYLFYFTGFILDLFLRKPQDLFIQAILVSRFYSALLSLILIPSTYFIGKKIANKEVGFLSALFSTLSVGFIQFAHFGTVEILLTFFGIWLFYFSLKLARNLSFKNISITAVTFGLLMATKISSLPLLILPLTAMASNFLSKMGTQKKYLLLLKILLSVLMLLSISLIIFTVLSPYVFLDFKSFFSSMQYESSVALGTLPVFYTGEFFNSIPVLFQFTKIYPFLINPLLTILFIFSFIYVSVIGLKRKKYSYLMLIAFYLILFLPQAFLFAKWTRYMIPTLPFAYLIIAIAIEDFFKKKTPNIKYLVLSLTVIISIVFAVSYSITVLTKQDSRISASLWAKENIKNNPNIISEVYDLGIVPFNPFFSKITLFNFYDLDNAGVLRMTDLNLLILKSEYIVLPSNRILKSRIINAKKFPIGHEFYTSFLNGTLGYVKVYETPCDIFCKITYLNDPIFSFEYTSSVFDRPTVFIFEKTNENL